MPATEQDGYKWVEISDFTPGIITNSSLAYPATNGNTGPVPGSKLGQAQSAVGCIALPNGGLAPLPGLVATPLAPNHAPAGGSVTTFINGLFVAGPLWGANLATTYDSLVYGQEMFNSGTGNWTFYLENIETLANVSTTTRTLVTLSPQNVPADGFFTLTGDTTRATSTPTNIGQATIAIAYWSHDVGYLWLYPDPTNSALGTPYQLINHGSPITAKMVDAICHQNRIIALLEVAQGFGPTLSTGVNEAFNYTEPPNSLTLGSQQEVFVQEHPLGNGTWGSISASQLFLVKHSGGAYLIQGDLNAPTVTRLPSVTSTYGLMSRAGETPIGLVYASANRGLWTWQGGASSTKISNQLDDSSFNPTLPAKGVEHGPTIDVRGWGDWIVATNDWLFDTNTGGWWKLTPSATGQAHLFYAVSGIGDTLYASVPLPTASTAIDMYSRTTPANTFTWKSFPIRLPDTTKNRPMMVREIVVRVQGHGTVTAVLEGVNGTTTSSSSSPASGSVTFTTTAQPSMQRITVGQVNAQDITVTLTSTGIANTPAPIVYSVAIGYEEFSQPVSAT